MEIIKNNKLLERKHFLMRGIFHKNVNETEAENEIRELDKQIFINTQEKLNECKENLKIELLSAKKVIKTDGPLKREIARIIIKFLEETGFDNDEIKGFCRQGYKMTRNR